MLSNSFEQHWEMLSLMFELLRGANLKLKPTKCEIFQWRLNFLGSLVSEEGIESDLEKEAAVKEWPTPNSLIETRALVAWLPTIVGP